MQLTGKQFDLLHKAIIDHFDFHSLYGLLRTLDRHLDHKTSDSTGKEKLAHVVIIWAEEEFWLLELVEAISRRRPEREDLRVLSEQLRSSTLGSPAPDGTTSAPATLRRRFPKIAVYLEHLPKLIAAQAVSSRFIWPHIRVLDEDGREGEPISDSRSFVVGELIDEPRSRLLLLGGYGSGKTSLGYMLGYHFLELLSGSQRALVPFFLNLAFARDHATLLEALSAYIKRYGIGISSDELSQFMFAHGEVVLYLDGFDEMANRIDHRHLPKMIDAIQSLGDVPGLRVVVTSRTTFFRSRSEFGIVSPTRVVELLPFTDEDVRRYVGAASADAGRAARTLAMIRRSEHLHQLCRVPIHLSMLCESAAMSTRRPAGRTGEMSIHDLYDRFATKNLQRNFGVFGGWPLDDRRQFIRELAYHWHREKVFEWTRGEFADYFKRSNLLSAEVKGADVDLYVMFLVNCSFFSLFSSKYRFSHLSFLEFFVAERIATDLLQGRTDSWNVPFYTEIFEFVYQHLARVGLDRIDFAKLLANATPMATGGVLTMALRHRVPQIEPLLRHQILTSRIAGLRSTGIQGLSLYEPSRENVETVSAAYRSETNSILRLMLRLTVERWLRTGGDDAATSSLRSILDEPLRLDGEAARRDAHDILHPDVPGADGVKFAYERAIRQTDGVWTSYAWPILTLVPYGEEKVFSSIAEAVRQNPEPEVHSAYEMVRRLRNLPAVAFSPATGATE